MTDALDPESGRWYKRRDDGSSFEVLFVDSDDGDIEIRYFDGAIELLDLSTWYQLRLARRAPPEPLSSSGASMSERADPAPMAQACWTGPLDWGGFDE